MCWLHDVKDDHFSEVNQNAEMTERTFYIDQNKRNKRHVHKYSDGGRGLKSPDNQFFSYITLIIFFLKKLIQQKDT